MRREFIGGGDFDLGFVERWVRGNGEGGRDVIFIGRRWGSSIFLVKRGRVLVFECDFLVIVFDDFGCKIVVGVFKDEFDDFGFNDNSISIGRCDIVKVGMVVDIKIDSEGDCGECLDMFDKFGEGGWDVFGRRGIGDIYLWERIKVSLVYYGVGVECILEMI